MLMLTLNHHVFGVVSQHFEHMDNILLPFVATDKLVDIIE
jgi:hypothetical protein